MIRYLRQETAHGRSQGYADIIRNINDIKQFAPPIGKPEADKCLYGWHRYRVTESDETHHRDEQAP